MSVPKTSTDGFTIVETLITLIIAVIFVLAINTIFITVIRATSSTSSRAVASNLAYSNLRKYAYAGATPSWFKCDSNSDLQLNKNALGQSLEGGNIDSSQTSLPQPVKYTVTAYSPYGCAASGAPVLVRSQVVYGPDNLSVVHATFVGSDI